MQYAYPFRFDKNGRTASATDTDHIKQLIEQVLFTSQGERVNRPTFGSGLNQLVFAPLSDDLVTATQALVQGSLQQWLSDLIRVESVTVTGKDSSLNVLVAYSVRATQQRVVANITREF